MIKSRLLHNENYVFGGYMVKKRSIILSILSLMCLLGLSSNLQAQVRFGYEGRSGLNGVNGRNGQKGISTTITLIGQNSEFIDISGKDGQEGGNGFDGESAYSCYQPSATPYNLRGASGGDSGNGGNGGDGGDAGKLTIFTKTLDKLANLTVEGSGGLNGRGGFSGNREGLGCRCTWRNWGIPVCLERDPRNPRRCRRRTVRRFFCEDGAYGRRGRNGLDGRRGQDGQIEVVVGKKSLEEERKTIRLYLLNALNTRLEKLLIDHRFEKQSGAMNLLARGSRVQDEFSLYTGTYYQKMNVLWNAETDEKEFLSEEVEFKRNQFYFVKDNWADIEMSRSAPDQRFSSKDQRDVFEELTFTIKNFYPLDKVANFKLSNISGSNNNFKLEIEDLSSFDLLKKSFYINFFIKRRFGNTYVSRYQTEVPSRSITTKGNLTSINLSNLGLDMSLRRPGTLMIIELKARHHFEKNDGTKLSQEKDLKAFVNVGQNWEDQTNN